MADPCLCLGSCHMFRHAMATLMLENGADLRYVQHNVERISQLQALTIAISFGA